MSFGNLCILRYKFKFTDSIILLIPTPTPMGFFCYFIFSSKISTFFFFNIYLFIWLHWSYWRHMGSSVITAVCGIFSCSIQVLSCSKWDLIPNQESNLGPLHREYRVLAAVSSGKSLHFFSIVSVYLLKIPIFPFVSIRFALAS